MVMWCFILSHGTFFDVIIFDIIRESLWFTAGNLLTHTHTYSWISQETKPTAEKELYSKELRSRFSLFFTWNIHMKPFIRFPATFLNPTSSFSEWIPEKERFPCVFIIFQNSPTQIIGTQPQKTTPQRCGQTNGALFGVSETAAN